jgi:hypothetical protein
MNLQSQLKMNVSSTQPRLAVLIDSENFPLWAIERIWPEIEKLGNPVIRRVYGDIATNSKRWAELSTRLALESRRQAVHSIGMNATDIVMVIDAMDILASANVDAFCLVSSDSDFTALAVRLRQADRLVFGFGEPRTIEAFRVACSQFFVFNFKEDTAKAGDILVLRRPSVALVVPHLLNAVKLSETNDEWVSLSTIGQYFVDNVPDFDLATYGVKTLKALVTRTGRFEIGRGKGGSLRMRERLKPRPG